MKPRERIDLIDKVGRSIQANMTTADIPGYLAAFGVQVEPASSVASKWVWVKALLADVSEDTLRAIARDQSLEVSGAVAPAALDLKRVLSERGMQVCEEDFGRALESVATDPAGAIGHACASLESICKTILEALGVSLPKEESLKSLVKAVANAMGLSPDGHADADLKQLLGGLANAAAGIAVIRTKYSAFHGKSPAQRRLVGRHARLAVNSAAAVGLFLVETYVARHQGSDKDDMRGIEQHIAELEEQQNAPFTDEARAKIRRLFRPSPKRT